MNGKRARAIRRHLHYKPYAARAFTTLRGTRKVRRGDPEYGKELYVPWERDVATGARAELQAQKRHEAAGSMLSFDERHGERKRARELRRKARRGA